MMMNDGKYDDDGDDHADDDDDDGDDADDDDDDAGDDDDDDGDEFLRPLATLELSDLPYRRWRCHIRSCTFYGDCSEVVGVCRDVYELQSLKHNDDGVY